MKGGLPSPMMMVPGSEGGELLNSASEMQRDRGKELVRERKQLMARGSLEY